MPNRPYTLSCYMMDLDVGAWTGNKRFDAIVSLLLDALFNPLDALSAAKDSNKKLQATLEQTLEDLSSC